MQHVIEQNCAMHCSVAGLAVYMMKRLRTKYIYL